MFETVTVDQALSKARRTITIPGVLIFLALLAIPLIMLIKKEPPVWVWPVFIGSGFLFSWLYWSILIPKWKVWAFENVRNVHELKIRAIEEKLIFSDFHFFTKSEIWTREDRLKWDLMQDKFYKKDDYRLDDDQALPAESIVYYSKAKNLVEMVLMLTLSGAGIATIIINKVPLLGVGMVLIGLYLAYREYRQATNKTVQIIINDKGIETIKTKFFNWKDIESENVELFGAGKNSQYILSYQHHEGFENLPITDYNINHRELRKMLRVYRGRSMRN